MSQDTALLEEAVELYKRISVGFLYPHTYDIGVGVYPDREELQDEYLRLFGNDPLCPLDISYYLSDNEFMQSRLMADIAGFYRAFGLDVNENLKVDNLSVCFEFLSYLCLKQLYAIEKGYYDKLKITEDAFDSFLDEFIKPALPKFLALLKKHSKNKFYIKLAELAQDTILNGGIISPHPGSA